MNGLKNTLLFLVLAASCVVFNRSGAAQPEFAGNLAAQDQNPLIQALGGSKQIFGDILYLRSESYFHGGLDANLVPEEEGPDEHGPAEEETHHAPKIPAGWIGRVNQQIRVVEHRHLEEQNASEILPLLYAAQRLDAGNADIALSLAYWIQRETGRASDAAAVLEKALSANPRGWEMAYELGMLHAFKMNDSAKAVPYFRQALSEIQDTDSLVTDRIKIHYEFGRVLESLGEREEARKEYAAALALYPADRHSALVSELEAKLSNS